MERELGMQPKHREHIEKNIEKLISCTNYNALVKITVDRGLLSPDMRENIERLSSPLFNMYNSNEEAQYQRHKEYFLKITKRGPTAYEQLKVILADLGYEEAFRILCEVAPNSCLPFHSLNPRNTANGSSNSHKSADIVDNCLGDSSEDGASVRVKKHNDAGGPLTPYTEPVFGQKRVVIKSDRFYTDEVLGTYPMTSQHNRGVLLLVNIIDFRNPEIRRNGAEVDGESLIHIFREIGFTIFSYQNLDQSQFYKKLHELIESHYVRDTESFVMVLMTHGERVSEVDKVQFSDGSFDNVKSIIDQFRPDICPYLIGKPKVLIFPFCRGDKPDQGIRVQDILPQIQTDGTRTVSIPTLSDIMVCYASTPGHETHRDKDEGSWYIRKFCDMMADHAHNRSLEDILKKTQAMVGNMRTGRGHLQTGSYENLGFNKTLFFHPGFFLAATEQHSHSQPD